MMELRNSRGESQNPDRSKPIQKIDGDGSKLVGGPVDVVADGGGGGAKVEVGNAGGGAQVVKKKRGRPPRVQANPPSAKKSKEEEEEEDVCFICFDGGSLVLCDRRGCPKAYHPSCIKRDEAFFRSKAKWNCGWHICSICEKTAHHMCYTCTYSLCKGCIKKADYVCVRGDKGFCTICMKTIMLIENSAQGETAQVDFDDKMSWEYLFKVYWVYLKEKLSLTLDELTRATNPWKRSLLAASVNPSVPTSLHVRPNGLRSITSDLSLGNLEANESKRRKTHEETNGPQNETISMDPWASKELLDFVAHMKNGDTSMLSQFDVQALLLEYIKRNNLRDPRKKNQIVCDLRLMNLFGKPRVGHIEMLKLLEFHFFVKESSQKNTIENDDVVVVGKDKERRNHGKGEQRAPQNKLDEYAAIDVHNMNLIYLRRNLVENLVEDRDKFHEKVVGSIVQIRISGSEQKHDMYRLVQVVGTTKVDVPYKTGEKSVDVMLEVLNLDKKEAVSIDTISNQELSEDDCRRLRESIRCGLMRCFTVGEIQEKAMALQSVLLDDRMETEMMRLNQLRDRASEKGQKKGLRECVQKLQILKTPEERERRLHEIPEVHSDPKMNPDYESDDTEEYFNNEHGEHVKPKYPWVSGSNTISPRKSVESLNDQPKNLTVMTYPNPADDSSKAISNTGKDPLASPPPNEADSDGLAVMKRNRQAADDGVWYYRDPNENIQGPFSMVQLQKWNESGYFPADMRIWASREGDSVLLHNVLQDKVGNRIEGFDVSVNPYTLNPVGHGSSGHSDPGGANECSPVKQFDINQHVSSAFSVADEKVQDGGANEPSVPPAKLLVQESPSWSTTLSLVVGGAQLPGPPDEWGGYGSATVKREQWDDHVAAPNTTIDQIMHSSPPPPPPSSSQPLCNNLPPWHGLGETIEFSTLAEESVSDLLAEVDAMESRNGVPSPTSRRNSFLEDLFNGSIDDFSPTGGGEQGGTRSDGFSSTAEHLAATSQGDNGNVFDLVKRSTALQFSFGPQATSSDNVGFKWGRVGPPEIQAATRQDMIDLNDSTKAEADEGEREIMMSDDRVNEKVKDHMGLTRHGGASGGDVVRPPEAGGRKSYALEGGYVKVKVAGRKLAGGVLDEEEEGEFIQPEALPPPPPPPPLPPPPPPPPMPPLTIGLDLVDSRRVGSETIQGNAKNTARPSHTSATRVSAHGASRSGNTGRERDSHHRRSGGDRYNSNSPRERSHHVDDSGHSRSSRASWGRQSSFGSGSGGGSGSGSHSRPPSKGQRVCKFYESGRCKKGSACNYLHP